MESILQRRRSLLLGEVVLGAATYASEFSEETSVFGEE
jgi:hypothetical protein